MIILQGTAISWYGANLTALRALAQDLIDSLLFYYKRLEDLIGENGLLKQLTKALVERALQA